MAPERPTAHGNRDQMQGKQRSFLLATSVTRIAKNDMKNREKLNDSQHSNYKIMIFLNSNNNFNRKEFITFYFFAQKKIQTKNNTLYQNFILKDCSFFGLVSTEFQVYLSGSLLSFGLSLKI